jgi:hypothetical protein
MLTEKIDLERQTRTPRERRLTRAEGLNAQQIVAAPNDT